MRSLLENGAQQLGNGDWKPENGGRNWRNGDWKLEIGTRKMEIGTRRRGSGAHGPGAGRGPGTNRFRVRGFPGHAERKIIILLLSVMRRSFPSSTHGNFGMPTFVHTAAHRSLLRNSLETSAHFTRM